MASLTDEEMATVTAFINGGKAAGGGPGREPNRGGCLRLPP